jgi:hypothetical protein
LHRKLFGRGAGFPVCVHKIPIMAGWKACPTKSFYFARRSPSQICSAPQQQLEDCFLSEVEPQVFSSGSITQQHEDDCRPSAEFITAIAQPTPALTESAPVGQFFAHAPHSMHESRAEISTWPLLLARTACGHTCKHVPQPEHLASSSCKVATFFK